MRSILFLFLLFTVPMRPQATSPQANAAQSAAQNVTQNAAQEDPPDEIGKFKKNCPFKHLIGCAEVLFTGQPLHIAVGSIAPQNGFGAGLAYVGHKTTDNWRTSWSTDAVASSNGSWRAGLYMKFVDTRMNAPEVVFGTGTATASDFPVYTEQPVFNLYAQSISLNRLTFFGEGPGTSAAGRSFFGMTEHIFGGNMVRPIYQRLNMGVYAELNGRVVDIRASRNQDSPSIEQVYTPAQAPGLDTQPFFFQPGIGVRMRPTAFHNLLHFNYDVAYRPYWATSGKFSFQRLTADLYQEISLYHTNMRVPRDTNGPNDCVIDPTADNKKCPAVKMRSMEGTLGLRAFTSLSMTPGGNTVPFYFQPTLGGSDINGNPALPSYQDYRFRAPNILLFRENFEHSLGGLPLGFIFLADQAKLALTRGDLGSNHWVHSYAAGVTLRAGGFPQVSLLFAFGGKEGTHTTVNVNNSLLGTSGRPSLF
ncbi:MAG TPA: hypothetical protein VFF39_08745 [Verrucomicrobiae bacterium]|nr:hypothetical protein [Verrucomicrobiae bacterium]